MFKFLLCMGIMFAIYCIGVGFLRTAVKLGWTESDLIASPR